MTHRRTDDRREKLKTITTMHNKFAQLRESRKQNNEPITVVHIPSTHFVPCSIFVDPAVMPSHSRLSVCRIHVLRYNFKIIFLLKYDKMLKQSRKSAGLYQVYSASNTYYLLLYRVHYYAALLPRRGPHIASHSVCLSVCPSVPLSLPLFTSFRPR